MFGLLVSKSGEQAYFILSAFLFVFMVFMFRLFSIYFGFLFHARSLKHTNTRLDFSFVKFAECSHYILPMRTRWHTHLAQNSTNSISTLQQEQRKKQKSSKSSQLTMYDCVWWWSLRAAPIAAAAGGAADSVAVIKWVCVLFLVT